MSNSELIIKIDPRIELLMTVQILSDYNNIVKKICNWDIMSMKTSKYNERIKSYFSKGKQHKIFRIIEKMASKYFNMGAPVETMLYLSDPPELDILYQFNDFVIKRASGKRRLKKFVKILRDFSIKTDFISFYNDNNYIYDKLVLSAKKVSNEFKHIELLEDYYGISQNSYNLIIAPLSRGSYGPHLNIDGKKDLYNICGMSNVDKDGNFNIDKFIHLIWHEFSHPFINPITEKNKEVVEKYFYRHKDIMPYTKRSGYGRNWEECINEHIIRATNVRFAELEFGIKKSKEMLKNEMKQGFIYVPELCKSLKRYENNRSKYITIEEYFPELLKVFSLDLEDLSIKN